MEAAYKKGQSSLYFLLTSANCCCAPSTRLWLPMLCSLVFCGGGVQTSDRNTLKKLKASNTTDITQDWVERVAEVRMQKKKMIGIMNNDMHPLHALNVSRCRTGLAIFSSIFLTISNKHVPIKTFRVRG